MADLDKQKLVVVCGPTASGKTALGVSLAQRFGGEVISADSMQIYRGLDIGTAKVSAEEMQGMPHHLLNICPPEQVFSVADYSALARDTISAVAARGHLPILVGGTGLYLSTLVNGVDFVPQPPRQEYRTRLAAEAQQLGKEAMWEKLNAVDPEYAKTVHFNNTKRVQRALEIYLQTGCTMSQQRKNSLPAQKPYHSVILGLRFADREVLYARINARVEAMLAAGLLQEARTVYEHRTDYITAAQAIGYKEFFDYFEGTATLPDCVERLKRASRRYAKRQLTWFSAMPDIHWIEVDCCADVAAQASEIIRREEEAFGTEKT